MKLSDGIQLAYERQWSMINTFTVQIILPPKILDTIKPFGDDLNLSIISVSTPDFTNDPIEIFVANKWVIQNGRDTLYRFNITFRDHDQMSLYKKFMYIYNQNKIRYFDDVALQIIITKDGDWDNENDKTFMRFEGVLIEGISNIQFSNDTENQIAEFTVNFKCNNPIVPLN